MRGGASRRPVFLSGASSSRWFVHVKIQQQQHQQQQQQQKQQQPLDVAQTQPLFTHGWALQLLYTIVDNQYSYCSITICKNIIELCQDSQPKQFKIDELTLSFQLHKAS